MKDIDKFYDEIIGEDLKRLLDDEDVSEISLNHNGDVFFKKINKINLSTEIFKTNIVISYEKATEILKAVAEYNNIKLEDYHSMREDYRYNDRNNNIISAILPNGERIDGILEIDGISFRRPMFVIRKKNSVYGAINLFDFCNSKIITENQLGIIKKSLKEYKNIMVVGGSMTGKTSFLNACLREIEEISDVNEKIVTIENSPNLITNTSNAVSILSDFDKMSNAINLSKRLRADRLIIDELNDSLGLYELIGRLDNGIGGTIFSVPALNEERGLSKLNSYIEELYNVDEEYINQVETNVNLIVRLYKDKNFEKKAKLFEILGYDKENKKYILLEVGLKETKAEDTLLLKEFEFDKK
jgi:type II secretion system protein E